ncbi:MAG: transcription initiation protein [Burkholderiaceae bacterium]
MAKYLVSFPSKAMVVSEGEWGAVSRDAHAVMDEAKAAGVYVFGGGFTVLELPSREEALAWAARIARACRCDQELRDAGVLLAVDGLEPSSQGSRTWSRRPT